MDSARRMGGYCQASVTTRPWSVRPLVEPGELLSPYLVRAAHLHGMSPSRFVSYYLPRAQVWTRDVDLYAPEGTLRAIAQSCGSSIDLVRAMTLPSVLPRVDGTAQPMPRHSTWFTSLGMHGRSRTGYGLQYCPLCLQASGAFLKIWRLSFVVACSEHCRMLEDRCNACGAPVALHKSVRGTTVCHRCGMSLSRPSRQQAGSLVNESLNVQQEFLDLLQQEQVRVLNMFVDRSEFFAGLAMMLRIVREKMHSHRTDFDVYDHAVIDSHEALRSAAAVVRIRLCSRLLDVVRRWPDAFVQNAATLGFTQVAFARLGEAPPWLREQIEQLPQRLRPRFAYHRSTLIKRVRQIEDAGGASCREKRAFELLNAARSWS